MEKLFETNSSYFQSIKVQNKTISETRMTTSISSEAQKLWMDIWKKLTL